MSQIATIAKFTCIDGKRDDLYAGLAPLIDHAESEEGTLLYQLLEDPNDPNVVRGTFAYSTRVTLISIPEANQDDEFSFLGRDEEGELTQWSNRWDEVSTLPSTVSLDIEFNEDVYIEWPLMLASVRTDPGSVRDPGGGQSGEQSYSAKIRELMNRRKNKQ